MDEKDLDQELRSFVDHLTDEKIRQGMAPADARRAALVEFGGMTQVKERVRDVRRLAWLDVFRQDLRYALRALRRNRGFATAVIGTLALGAGANAVVFGIVNAVLLRPLPFPEPDRLVSVSSSIRGESQIPASPPDAIDWRTRATSFAHLAVVLDGRPVNLTGLPEPERLIAARVSAAFFPAMAVQPALGRAFFQAEESTPVAVLGHDLWVRRFSADRNIVGAQIQLDGRAHTIVGVMPRAFRYPEGQDLWLPLAVETMQRWGRRAHVLDVVGRLRPDVTPDRAAAEMQTIAAALAREHPDSNRAWSAAVEPLRDRIVGRVRRPLWVLLGAVFFVLLIACANIANLLLARGTARAREIAIRTAIGAGRQRVIRQLLTESLILSTLGSGLGLALAFAAGKALRSVLAGNLPRSAEIGADGATLGFTIAVAAVTTAIFGLTPAWQLARTPLAETLKSGGRNPGNRGGLLRHALVVGQLALAVVLLTGAGLLLASFLRVYAADLGFRADRLLTLRVSLPPRPGAADARHIVTYYDAAIDRLRAIPGVEAAAAIAALPLSGDDPFLLIRVEGEPPDGQERRADTVQCTAAYFDVMGIPILRGRAFDARDQFAAAPVAIVNQAFVRQHLGGRDPLGRRVIVSDVPRTIVGVAGDIRQRAPDRTPGAQVYLHQSQWPSSGMTFVVRTAGNPAAAAPDARAAIRSIDPSVPVYSVRTMEDVVSGAIAPRRFTTTLLTGFSAAALLLAAMGVFGVMSYLVAQRGREIGIRVALGAGPGEVLRLVFGRGMALAGVGVAAGCAAALGLTRFLAGLLFEVRPAEPAIYGAVAVLLLAAAALACVEPARRALKVDPLSALRQE